MPATAHVWHKSTNIAGANGEAAANGFKIYLPGVGGTLSGNTLVLDICFPPTATVSSITTDQGQSFTQDATFTNANIIRIYRLSNATAGTKLITVTFAAAVATFGAKVTEYAGVAASPTVTAAAGAGPTAPTVATGAISPAAGALIHHAAWDGSLFNSAQATSVSAGTGFTRLSATLENGGHHAQYRTAPGGSITPTMTVNGSTNVYDTLAIALTGDTAQGTAGSGIRIVGEHHAFMGGGSAAAFKCQFVSSGNLLVFTSTYSNTNNNVSTITDGNGNTWTKIAFGGSRPNDCGQVFYAKNATPGEGLILTINHPAATVGWFVMYDIAGADTTATPTTAVATGTQAAANDNVLAAPSITPTTAPGLILAQLVLGTGPPSNTLTSGAIFDSIWYSGETDASALDSGDGSQHYYNATTSAVSIDWSIANPVASQWDGTAVAFAAAPTGAAAFTRRVLVF